MTRGSSHRVKVNAGFLLSWCNLPHPSPKPCLGLAVRELGWTDLSGHGFCQAELHSLCLPQDTSLVRAFHSTLPRLMGFLPCSLSRVWRTKHRVQQVKEAKREKGPRGLLGSPMCWQPRRWTRLNNEGREKETWATVGASLGGGEAGWAGLLLHP